MNKVYMLDVIATDLLMVIGTASVPDVSDIYQINMNKPNFSAYHITSLSTYVHSTHLWRGQ